MTGSPLEVATMKTGLFFLAFIVGAVAAALVVHAHVVAVIETLQVAR